MVDSDAVTRETRILPASRAFQKYVNPDINSVLDLLQEIANAGSRSPLPYEEMMQ